MMFNFFRKFIFFFIETQFISTNVIILTLRVIPMLYIYVNVSFTDIFTHFFKTISIGVLFDLKHDIVFVYKSTKRS